MIARGCGQGGGDGDGNVNRIFDGYLMTYGF